MKSVKSKSRRNIIFYIMVIIASLIIAVIMFLPHVSEKVWPYKTYVVVSDSMEPLIKKNDMIVVKINESYNIGDIITFSYDINNDGQDDLITHFLASRNEDVIKTRSNKGNTLDYWEISEKDIVGKVKFVVPKVGYVLIPIFKNAVFFLGFALILVLASMAKVILELKKAQE